MNASDSPEAPNGVSPSGASALLSDPCPYGESCRLSECDPYCGCRVAVHHRRPVPSDTLDGSAKAARVRAVWRITARINGPRVRSRHANTPTNAAPLHPYGYPT